MSGGRSLPAGYGSIEPVSNYMPWTTDTGFRAVYDAVRAHTMVDELRCWDLWVLAGGLGGLDGEVLEVGAWRGGTAGILGRGLARAASLSPTPAAAAGTDTAHRRLVVADTFEGVVKAGPKDPYFRGGEYANTSRRIVERLLAELGVRNFLVLEGVFPDDTAAQVEESRFALCHVDVDVYESAKQVTEWVWPRLVDGGIVVYDDYGFYGCEGVTAFVEEAAALPDRLFVHNINGHALFVKRAGPA